MSRHPRLRAVAAIVALQLVAAMASATDALAAGQSPDWASWRAINAALGQQAAATGAGEDGTGAALDAIGSVVMVTPAGQAFQASALRFAAAQGSAAQCVDIVRNNPSFAGVNAFLVCISPINAILIAEEQAMAQQSSKIAANSSPNVGPGQSPSLAQAHAILAYATTVHLTTDIVSGVGDLRHAIGVGRSVINVGAEGILRLDLPEAVRYVHPEDGRVAVIYAYDEEQATEQFAQLVGTADLGAGIQDLLDDGAPSPAVQAPFVGGVAPAAPEPGGRARAAAASAGITVASAPAGTAASVLVAPPWTRVFVDGLYAGRVAEEAALTRLLGLSPRDRPQGDPTVRLRGRAGLTPGDARALEAVVTNQAARAHGLQAYDAALRRIDRAHGKARRRQRAGAARQARRLSALYRKEPRVRAAAVAALRRPTSGGRIVAVVKAPGYADLDVASLLRDRDRDRASRRLATTLARSARSLAAARG